MGHHEAPTWGEQPSGRPGSVLSQRQLSYLIAFWHMLTSAGLVLVLRFQSAPQHEDVYAFFLRIPTTNGTFVPFVAAILSLVGTAHLQAKFVRAEASSPIVVLVLALAPLAAAIGAASAELHGSLAASPPQFPPDVVPRIPGIQLRPLGETVVFGMTLAAAQLSSWLFWSAAVLAVRRRMELRAIRVLIGLWIEVPVLLAVVSLMNTALIGPDQKIGFVVLVGAPCLAHVLLLSVRAQPSLSLLGAVGAALSTQAWAAHLVGAVEACEFPWGADCGPAAPYERAVSCLGELPGRWVEVSAWLPGAIVVVFSLVYGWRLELGRSFVRSAFRLLAPLAALLVAERVLVSWVLRVAESDRPVSARISGFLSRDPGEYAPPPGAVVVTPTAIFLGGSGATLLTDPWLPSRRAALVALLASRGERVTRSWSFQLAKTGSEVRIAVDRRLSTAQAKTLLDAALVAGIDSISWVTNEERIPVDAARPTAWIAHSLANANTFSTWLVRPEQMQERGIVLAAGAESDMVDVRGGRYAVSLDVSKEPGRGELERYLESAETGSGPVRLYWNIGHASNLDAFLSTLSHVESLLPSGGSGMEVAIVVYPSPAQ